MILLICANCAINMDLIVLIYFDKVYIGIYNNGSKFAQSGLKCHYRQ